MLQVHGDKDTNVAYDGTPFTPSAHQTVAIWADRNAYWDSFERRSPSGYRSGACGCGNQSKAYAGCRNDGSVELWTIEGVVTFPNFNSSGQAPSCFLMAHPKP